MVDRDVAAFGSRAAGYDEGVLGRLHHEIATATADLIGRTCPPPSHLLDVGCGTGYLLSLLAARFPDAVELAGVDAAPEMVAVAGAADADPRVGVTVGHAERLVFPDGRFDLVVTTTSFDHWADQAAGLAECRRVLADGGALVLADLFSAWLAPTVLRGRPGRARTPRSATRLLAGAGFTTLAWHPLCAGVIKAVTARA